MSVGGATIGTALAWLAVAVAVLIVISLIVIALGRRRGSTTLALDVTQTLSAGVAAVWILFTIIRFGAGLATDQLTFSTDQVSIGAAVDLPCGVYKQGVEITGPTLTCVSPTEAFVQIESASFGPRFAVASGELLTSIAVVAPIVLIAVVSFQALRGLPFARVVTRALYVTAGVVLVTGIAGAVVTPLAQHLAVAEATPEGSDYLPPSVQLSLPMLPIAIALVCAALASITRYGARIQRDTEGLV